MQNESRNFHCGYVALIGRPNVGKSTLLNRLMPQKISITSKKPQTTRHRILGVKTREHEQVIYVDTPGLHRRRHHKLNKIMNQVAQSSWHDVDVLCLLVEALKWTVEEDWIIKQIQQYKGPVILVVNKIDQVKDKSKLLPFLDEMSKKYNFSTIIPLSALSRKNIDRYEQTISQHLPQGIALFPADQVTDVSERFRIAEIIREKLMRQLGQEIPYALTVTLESMEEKSGCWHIAAIIWVARNSHKPIVIGQSGAVLKKVGSDARRDIESILNSKVHLNLWVKAKENWLDDTHALRRFGFE